VYPGPVGDLIHREIQAFLDFGHRFDGSGLIARLVNHVMTTDSQAQPGMPGAVRTEVATR
jgi:hypothetical protein